MHLHISIFLDYNLKTQFYNVKHYEHKTITYTSSALACKNSYFTIDLSLIFPLKTTSLAVDVLLRKVN